MELSSLRTFLCVAEERSLTKAAVRLNTVQSNVSTRVRQLEEEIGHPLFSRTRQGMTPTEHGERLLPLAKDLLNRAEEVGREARSSVSESNLRIATPDAFLRAFLLDPLRRWKEDHPNSRIHLRTGFSPDNLAALHSGVVDLAVIMARKRPGGVFVIRAIQDELVFVSPAGTGLKQLDSLRGLQPYILGDACFFGHALADLCNESGLVGEHRQVLSSVESILQCIRVGLGMTVLPRSLVGRLGAEGSLLVEDLPKKAGFKYYKVCLPERAMSQKVQEISRYF